MFIDKYIFLNLCLFFHWNQYRVIFIRFECNFHLSRQRNCQFCYQFWVSRKWEKDFSRRFCGSFVRSWSCVVVRRIRKKDQIPITTEKSHHFRFAWRGSGIMCLLAQPRVSAPILDDRQVSLRTMVGILQWFPVILGVS